MQAPPPVLLLSATEIAGLFGADEALAAVERAFRLLHAGEAPPPIVAGHHAPAGTYHWKAAWWPGPPSRFAAKLNANYPGNPSRYDLPTIQGSLVLCDGETGSLLSVMDASVITALRTAAATALAAAHLARADATRLCMVGCGAQAAPHVRALSRVRALSEVVCVDVRPEAAEALATWTTAHLGVPARRGSLPDTRDADIVVTCTPSTSWLLDVDSVRPGSFVAGVGADAEHKRELAPGLLARGRVVVDVLDQAARMGDLRGAIEAEAMTRDDVHAELGAVVVGDVPGRRSDEEVIVFDSTGMALQDAACAALVFDRAVARGVGLSAALS